MLNLEKDATAWLEPMREWLETVSTLDEIAKRNDLRSKKSSLQKIFGSNLFLHDKKVQEKASAPYAALRAARQNFASSDTSFIAVAEFGFAPKFQGYEPRELLLLYPAMLSIIYSFCFLAIMVKFKNVGVAQSVRAWDS